MQLNITQYNSDSLSHNSKSAILLGEASDMQFNGFEQLYDDACDVGIALINPRTGNVTRWYMEREIRSNNADNELQGWVLRPCSESIHKQPELAEYTFNIIND